MAKDYTPFQVLAKDDVYRIWTRLGEEDAENKTSDRQARIQEMIRVGDRVERGELAVISPEKKAMYDAIETLLRQGVLPSAGADAVGDQKPQEPARERKRPDLGAARRQFSEHRK